MSSGFFMGRNGIENGINLNGKGYERPLLIKNEEPYVLSLTTISFLADFVVFKTPHNALGFYCGGTVTTFAKLEDAEKPAVVFDQFNTICNTDCGVRTVFPLKGEETIQAINTARKLEATLFLKPK